ncbi:unnamed protein product, partial [Mesorhabditis belari]|uniref:Uncharacterized protein n=1 Tax=Mesorhabditis belari TaxID=2138241 RepID=A0AAF3ER96_9BILA
MTDSIQNLLPPPAYDEIGILLMILAWFYFE